MHSKKAKIHGLASRYGMGTHARDIWDEHPAVRHMTEKVFSRFGYLSLDAGKNVLVSEAIRDGAIAYNMASRSDSQSDAAVHYFKAFFERISQALHHEIYVGGARWQPLTMNLNDMVGGETVVLPGTKKWKHKEMTPLKAVLLSFMAEEACTVIERCKLVKGELMTASK